jgi:hypothetical protein
VEGFVRLRKSALIDGLIRRHAAQSPHRKIRSAYFRRRKTHSTNRAYRALEAAVDFGYRFWTQGIYPE